MVKDSSGPHGPQRMVATGCVLHGQAAPAARGPRAGLGRQAAICLLGRALWASASTFPGSPLTHRAFFSFPSPQPLHNRHHEPGYLFYSQSAASSQLQVRHSCRAPVSGVMLSICPGVTHLVPTIASTR